MKDLVDASLKKNHWTMTRVNGITLASSPLLSSFDFIVHGFTTRHGGNSEPPLDGFNLGRHWPCDMSRSDAMKNRETLCQALNLPFDKLAVPGQQHTDNIEVVDDTPHGLFNYQSVDALATGKTGQPILLHFADCVPVVIVDTKRRSLCVVHAGWRGTAAGIAAKAVRILTEKLDSRPENMVAAVGPAIGSCCYATGHDVAEKLAATIKAPESLIEKREGTPYPDLKSINAMQLLQSGVPEVDVTEICTSCNPDDFYSHRAHKGQTGRAGAIACLK